MSEPLVTVITPCYNQERFIRACIESVRRQTNPNWEQIVVDDGSTDATASIVDEIGDPRVRVIRLPHRGLEALAESYNSALALARGTFIAVLEGDDVWPEHKLDVQLRSFDHPDIVLTWGKGRLIDSQGETTGWLAGIRAQAPCDFTTKALFARLVRTNVMTPAASVMVRTQPLKAIGGFQQASSRHFVDLATWLSVAARVDGRARFIDRELAGYRVHSSQTTQLAGRAMEAEHELVVRHVAAALSRDDHVRLGWADLERDLDAGGLITRARWKLADGDRHEARRLFREAVTRARLAPDRVKGLLGLASGYLGLNLLDVAMKLHMRRLRTPGARARR